MKSYRLPIVLLAVAAASASGAAGAASLSYQGVLSYSDPACTGSFVMDTAGNISCSTATPPPAGAPVCTLAASPSTITAGASVTLNASCTPAASSYSWSSNTNWGTNTLASGTVTPTTTTTYSVAGISGSLTGATAAATVTVSSTTPPPTGDDTLCTQAGLSNTEMPLNWTKGTYQNINIGLNQSVSFPLTLPTTSSGGRITMSYTSGGTEVISISRNKCDFSPSLLTTQCMVAGSAPNLTFQPAGSTYSNCALTPGVQYYVNVRNAVMAGRSLVFPIVDSCTGGKCYGVMSYLY
jgi:hypothetical protein